MDLKPFRHEATFVAGEVSLHLVMDFAAIERLETLTEQSLSTLLSQLGVSAVTAVKFIWATTRESNADLTLDMIAGMVFSAEHGPGLMTTLGDLVKRSFPNVFPDAVPAPKSKRRR